MVSLPGSPSLMYLLRCCRRSSQTPCTVGLKHNENQSVAPSSKRRAARRGAHHASNQLDWEQHCLCPAGDGQCCRYHPAAARVAQPGALPYGLAQHSAPSRPVGAHRHRPYAQHNHHCGLLRHGRHAQLLGATPGRGRLRHNRRDSRATPHLAVCQHGQYAGTGRPDRCAN